jgi:hypothetical protein
MHRIDVSVVVTLHRERQYLARTLASLSEAAAFACAHGIAVELVAVLDCADCATTAVFRNADLSGFANTQAVEVEFGSVSLSRNAGCSVAAGTYIDVIDGDDLVSYSSIVLMFAEAEQHGPTAVLVPKFSFGFGARYYTVEYFSQHDISAIGIVKYPLFTAKIFAHRSLFAQNQYLDLPLSRGYAYEDWHFNCNAMALGYRFVAVENTVLFYRQRWDSRNHRADRVSTRQIPPSRLFQPRTFLDFFASDARQTDQLIERVAPQTRGARVLDDPIYRDFIARANAIDPAVEIGRYHWNCQGHFSNVFDPAVGFCYYRTCEVVADGEFDAVFLLPGNVSGDSFDPVESTMHDLAGRSPQTRILALLDESRIVGLEADLPPSVVAVDLPLLCYGLSMEDRDLVCLKLLQSSAFAASMHCTPSTFARRFFARYGVLLQDRHITCYRTADHSMRNDGYPFIDPTAFEFVSAHIDLIDQVVAFDQETLAADRRRLPGMHEKWILDPMTTSAAA